MNSNAIQFQKRGVFSIPTLRVAIQVIIRNFPRPQIGENKHSFPPTPSLKEPTLSYIFCYTKIRKRKKSVVQCTCNQVNPDLRFAMLPRREIESARKDLWLQAIRLGTRCPSSYVCGKHFSKGKTF